MTFHLIFMTYETLLTEQPSQFSCIKFVYITDIHSIYIRWQSLCRPIDSPHLLHPKVQSHVHNNLPSVSTLRQVNRVHTPTLYFSEIYFNTILLSASRSSQWFILFTFSKQNFVCICHLHVCYMPRQLQLYNTVYQIFNDYYSSILLVFYNLQSIWNCKSFGTEKLISMFREFTDVSLQVTIYFVNIPELNDQSRSMG
jgi:hypothetical protein